MMLTFKKILFCFLLFLPITLSWNEFESVKYSDNQKIEWCLSNQDCRHLSEAIYHEARGESKTGMINVMNVIRNRALHASKRFPDTITGVITQRCEFSYRCDGSLNRKIDVTTYNKVVKRTFDFLNGKYLYKTDVLYYHTTSMKKYPRFSKVMTKVEIVDNHIFYKCDVKYC